MSTIKLAQTEEVMFERNIAIIAKRKQEVQIFSDSFVYEGYICGLDEKWVQIYGHEENDKNNLDTKWRFLLINKSKVSGLGPTGGCLDDLDDETREWISKKIKTFADVCERFEKSLRARGSNDREENTES